MTSPDLAYRNFRQSLRRYIARRLNDVEEIDDVLQDVFLRVARNRDALANAHEPLAWLYAVARSALIDHYRSRAKHAAVDIGGVPTDVAETPPDAVPDEFSDCLAPLLERLPDTYRDAIQFVDIDGGRQTDFAATRGLALSTVKSRVQRGRKQMKSAILACCRVERDGRRNVSRLGRGECEDNCC